MPTSKFDLSLRTRPVAVFSLRASLSLWFALCLSCLLPGVLPAQTSTGEFVVSVLDASGANIPGATVTVTGSATGNVVRTLTTDERGSAQVPLLPPSTYDVSVTANGFKSATRREVTVNSGSSLRIDISLETGSASESITVTGEPPLLEEKTASLGQVVDEKQILGLPLNGRNYLALANLTPGTVPSAGSRDQTFSAYGNTGLQNAFLLDGARNQNYLRGLDNRARDMVRPPLDALSEFTVQTSNFSAEFGSSAGGVVNAVTKSGTNDIHGSAYDFLRNNQMDARNYFATTKPLLVRNQYGGSLGGPVKKDRAWLFGAYEGIHNRAETTSNAVVPTVDQRAGNFGGTAIYDPNTTRANPNGSGYVRDQFPNNTIPQSRMNSLGLNLLARYPLANVAGSNNQYRRNVPELQDSKNAVIRGDVQVTSRDTMFARWAIARASLAASPTLAPPAGLDIDKNTNSDSLGYGYTRVMSPTLINEFRFTWTTIDLSQIPQQAREEIIPGSLDARVTGGTPTINVSGYAALGGQPGTAGNSPLSKTSGVWDLADNVSKTWGSHLVKMGGEFLWIRPKTFATSNGRSSFGFSGVFTQNPLSRSNSGSAVADLLLGDANSLTTGTIAENEERGWIGAGYIQDQWTVTRRFTVTLGVRYEYAAPFIETNNRMGNFILDPGNPLYGQMVFAGLNGQSRSLMNGDTNNWAPRVGFAWRVPGAKDMVIRGSYGIFYGQDQGLGVTSRLTSNPPFFGYGAQTISSDQLYPSSGFVLSPNASIARPTPIDPSAFVLNPTATSTLVSYPTNAKSSYVQQWNLSVQKQLPWNLLTEVNYVGNHGVGLIGQGEGNQPLVLSSTTVVSRRPLAQYTRAPVKQFGYWNMSNYQGMSAKLEKRFSTGMSFLTTLTYGHAIDFQNPALDACDSCGSANTIQNNYNRRANRASSDNDVRLRYVLAGAFESPFGKGKRFLSDSKVGSQLAGGWRLAVIYTTQTGLPFTPNLSFDNANAGTTSLPNRGCDGNLDHGTVGKWFDTSCFTVPAAYTFGNTGRNILRAPGSNNLDLSLQRDFRMPIEHATTLQFRGEAFNSLNHPQFGVPGITVGNALYGVITSTAVPNRQIQLGLRLSF